VGAWGKEHLEGPGGTEARGENKPACGLSPLGGVRAGAGSLREGLLVLC
jgi:hypothetical protein